MNGDTGSKNIWRRDWLQGMKVLDFTRLLPGPFATMRLADMGAEVIKVEDPVLGDSTRAVPPAPNGSEIGNLFFNLNRNKKSLAIDFKTIAGQHILHRMIEQADVIIESYRPGVMAQFGLEYETVSSLNPRLIYCSLTGYGQMGPLSTLAGHDINYIAVTGILDGIRDEQRAPVIPSVQIADLAGGMAASEQILAAWIRSLRTGKGTRLDVSMTDVLYGWHALTLPMSQDGYLAAKGSFLLNGSIAGYNVYQTKDENYVALGALEPKFWNRFSTAVGRPEWVNQGFASAGDREGIYQEIAELFRSKTREEWSRLGAEADCCLTPVLSLEETVRLSLDQEGKGFLKCNDTGGERILSNSGYLSGERDKEEQPVSAAPLRGQHSREILLDFGFESIEIETWIEQDIVHVV